MSDAPATTSAPASAQPQEGQPSAQPEQKSVQLPEKVRYKANGVEVEIPLHEAIRRAALADGAQGRLKEASEIRKRAEEELSIWEKNPIEALMKRKGISKQEALKFYEELVVDQLSQPELTEEQQELVRYREAEKAREAAEKAAQEEELTKKQQMELERELINLDKELNDAFSKTSLPPDPFLKAWATDLLRGAAHNGVEIDTEVAVKEVEHRYLTNLRNQLTSLDVKSLKSLLGESVMKKVREADVSALKEAEAPFRKPSTGAAKQEPKDDKKPEKRMSLQDKMNQIRGINYSKTK